MIWTPFSGATSLLPVERRNSRFVSLRVSRFISSDTFSARATSQEVIFTSLTENWLTSIQFIIIMKTRTRGKYIQLQALQQVRSGASSLHQRISLLLRQDASIYTGQERNSQRFIKCACHVKAISIPNSKQQLQQIHSHLSPNTEVKLATCRLGRWQSNNKLNQFEKEPRAGLRAD